MSDTDPKLNMDFTLPAEELQERIKVIQEEVDDIDVFDAKQRRNRIKCAKCNEIIESTFRHDFKSCGCGAVYVDGGKDYCRMGGNFEDIILMYDDDTEKPMQVAVQENTEHRLTAEDEREIDAMEDFADAQLLALDAYEEEMSLQEKYNSLEIRLTSLETTCAKIMRILENQMDDGK